MTETEIREKGRKERENFLKVANEIHSLIADLRYR